MLFTSRWTAREDYQEPGDQRHTGAQGGHVHRSRRQQNGLAMFAVFRRVS
jgi:hypothetical protein